MYNELNGSRLKSDMSGIAVFDRDFSVIWCSESVKTLFAGNPSELNSLCGKCLKGEFPASQGAAVTPVDNRYPQGVLSENEIEVGGELFNITFYNTPERDGEGSVITAVFNNLTVPEKMKQSYEKFRTHYLMSLEAAKIVPWEYDVKRRIISNIFSINIIFTDNVLELTLEEWERMIHPDDLARVKEGIDDVINMRSDEFHAEYRIIAGHGKPMWIRNSGRVTSKDENGAPLIVAGINQDITEMKVLEEKGVLREQNLRDSERRLKNAMTLGRMSPWEYDFASGTFITDRQMSEIWGYQDYYDRNARIDRALLLLIIHPDDRESVNRRFSEAVEKACGLNISYRIVVNDEIKYIHFEGEILKDDNNLPVKLIGVAQDITGIKKLENSLAKQLEGLRFIAEKIGLGLWEMDASSGIISVMNFSDHDDGSGEFSSMTTDELLEKVYPEDVKLLKRMMDSHLGGRENVIELELRIGTGDGQFKWCYITSAVSRTDENGKPSVIRGFYQDITERKEIETKLYQSQKMEAIGRLAGGIAHDFNNILQIILGYGSLAMMEADNDTELFQNISHIVDSGEKAKTLVRQLLLFARKEKFNPSLVSVNGLFSRLIHMLRRLIGENIILTFIPEDNLMSIYGDGGQLEQVFMNLCINSRDAISGSGTIIIRTKNLALDEFWPSFDNQIPPGNYVMISVSDTGCGIPAESINSLFEPFYTTKEKNSGTGLGLATVYSIVKQHSGYIDVYSIRDKGTTFTIYLPAAELLQESDTPEEKEPAARRVVDGGTILLAEDDELVRRFTSRVLTDSGYNVLIAEDGAAAVDLFRKHRGCVDLVILDVVMPKINGWDVYNMISGMEPGIPVVFFSGYDRNLLPEDISSIPNMRFVQKPFKYYTIIKALHELLD